MFYYNFIDCLQEFMLLLINKFSYLISFRKSFKIILKLMENNLQHVQNLVKYISQFVSLTRRLENKKIDSSTAKLAFTQLDTKRKGYLDLANVLELCGEVTEDELFYVFKWLDASKTGDVSIQDFQWALVSNRANEKNQKSNPIDSVKHIITTFLQNFDYSQNLKNKLCISGDTLLSVYRSICQSQRKTLLTVQDLLYVLSYSKKWDSLCQQEVKNLFREEKNISQKQFVQRFTPVKQVDSNETKYPKTQQIKAENPCNQTQLMDEINSEYMASRKAVSSNSKLNIETNSQKINILQTPKQRMNTFGCNSQAKSSGVDQKESKLGQIETMLSTIEKRRQDLRKGSLQRKKLIDEALSRKKTNFSTSYENDSSEIRNFSRPSSQSKPNSQSFFSIKDNNVNMDRNDFRTVLNKYSDQRSAILTLKDQQPTNSKSRYDNTYTSEENWNEPVSRFVGQTYSNNRSKVLGSSQLNTNQVNTNSYHHHDVGNYAPETPKFSQTAQQRFYQRPISANKIDRFAQIRQKINNLPERTIQKDNRQLDHIIEKYRHAKVDSSHDVYNKSPTSKGPQNIQLSQHLDRNAVSSYLRNNQMTFGRQNLTELSQTMNLKNYGGRNDMSYQRKPSHDSYLPDQKSRMNGSICSYRLNEGSLQKQNLLKRAQQQAARKIQQIQRRAKMKVLQRKSAAGLKWIK